MKGLSLLNSAAPKLALAAIAFLSINITVPAQTAPPAPAKPQVVEPWKKIPIPPLHAFKPAQPKRIELANGLS